MSHLSPKQLGAYFDRALDPAERARMDAHLKGCDDCLVELGKLASIDNDLARTLEHDPGEEYFERFSARVAERIEAEGAAPAAHAARATRRPFGSWLSSPRGLALAGTAAAFVVGGAVVLMTARQVESPTLARQKVLERSQRGFGIVSPPAVSPPMTAKAKEKEEAGAKFGDEQKQAATAPLLKSDAASEAAQPKALDETRDKEGLTRLESRERGRAVPPPVAAPAPSDARRASPGRALEVRRDPVTGEEVVVRPQNAMPQPSATAAPTPAPPASGPVRALKRGQVAQPAGGARKAQEEEGANARRAPEAASRAQDAAEPARRPAPAEAAPSLSLNRSVPGRMCGTVRDPAGQPVAGAQIAVVELGLTARTDAAGHFCVESAYGDYTLSVMAIGFRPARVPVGFHEGASALAFTLVPVEVLGAGRTPRAEADSTATAFSYRGKLGGNASRPSLASPAPPASGSVESFLQSSGSAAPLPLAFAALPDSLRTMAREAQLDQVTALERRSAAGFDAAAARWARLLPYVMGKPAELETRRRLAEARYRAWELVPDRRRALAASEALTAYLVRAPAGPQRLEAAKWLDRVKP